MTRPNGGAAAPARICPGCRKTRLSRYNPGSLCGACARAVQYPPCPAGAGYTGEGRTPAWTWDSPLLRDALARADLGGAVAIIRATAGMTQLQFADMLGWSQATVWRIEASERKSLYDIRELLRFADAIGMPRGALIPLLLSSPEGQPAGAGWPYPAAPATGEEARESHTEPSQLAKASYLRACARRLQEQDQAGGGARTRDHALHTWNAARRMLVEVTSPGNAGDDLASATGQLAISAGWACYDSGDPATARRLYAEALVLAQQAGDEALATQSMVTASLLLADGDRPGMAGQALALAERAAAHARREPSPRLHALMEARQALAHARLGDSAAFRAAITRAWRETGRSDPGDQPAWLDFARPAEIAVHEAKGRVAVRPAHFAAGQAQTFKCLRRSDLVKQLQVNVENGRLARGLDTRIGHRGGLLSAGERQRLALACALLRRPRLLLLDEATNAIDLAGEAAILHMLTELRPRATILMVAHRTESLRLCDEILEFPGPVHTLSDSAPKKAVLF